jgi:hypothetical protein
MLPLSLATEVTDRICTIWAWANPGNPMEQKKAIHTTEVSIRFLSVKGMALLTI